MEIIIDKQTTQLNHLVCLRDIIWIGSS